MKSMVVATYILALLLASGCATSEQQVKERYFWPPLPNQPKIEWIGTYRGQKDMEEGKGKGVLSFIVGEDLYTDLENPATLASDGHGKVYVSDLKLGVLVFDFTKNEVHTLGGQLSGNLFQQPSGIAFDENDNVYIADLTEKKIFVFDKNEKPLRNIAFVDSVKSISYIAIDKLKKRIIIPDVRGQKVLISDYDGKIIKTIDRFNDDKDGFRFPNSAAVDPKGNILIADSMNARVVRFSPEGEFLSTFGQRGDAVGDLSMIKAVAVDSEGHIYVTDAKSSRIQIYNEQGEILLAIGTDSPELGVIGGFYGPNGMYIDQNDAIYIVDKLAKRFQIYQYLNSKYLAEHPITKNTVTAKPRKQGGATDSGGGEKDKKSSAPAK